MDPSIISNKSYTTGTIQRSGEVLGSFRFGISETISIYDIASKIRQSCNLQDSIGERRKVVIFISDFARTFNALHCLKLFDDEELASVVSLMDLLDLGFDVLWNGNIYTQKFSRICTESGVPCSHISAKNKGGNRANYGIRALLLLAARDQEQLGHAHSNSKMINLLRQIGEAPLPPRLAERPELCQYYMDMLPTEPVDDPNVPVDMAYFNPKLPNKQDHRLLKKREGQAHKRAYFSRMAVQQNVMEV